MTTEDNLKNAFAGESQANRKYLAFARKADEEGFSNLAKLFRAIADAETVHALAHLRSLGTVKSSKENVEEAISGENYENTKMYPGFIKEAKAEKNKSAELSFDFANKVEKIHEGMYKKALANISKSKDVERTEIFVCQVCGNTVFGKAPAKCPICGAPLSMFKKIE
jgi:rubrerythrin